MGIREGMNQHRGVAVVATIIFTVAALALGAWHVWSNIAPSAAAGEKSFFTVDDGKTFFVDSSSKIPPFDYNGKQAVGCQVFTDDGGKTKYVAWMYRFTDEGKRRFERLRATKGAEMGPSPLECIEVKKPGAPADAWLATTSPKAIQLQRVGPQARSIMPE